MSGTNPKCKKYHKVEKGDGCSDLAKEYGVTLDKVSYPIYIPIETWLMLVSQFYSWNPGVGDDCEAL